MVEGNGVIAENEHDEEVYMCTSSYSFIASLATQHVWINDFLPSVNCLLNAIISK